MSHMLYNNLLETFIIKGVESTKKHRQKRQVANGVVSFLLLQAWRWCNNNLSFFFPILVNMSWGLLRKVGISVSSTR